MELTDQTGFVENILIKRKRSAIQNMKRDVQKPWSDVNDAQLAKLHKHFEYQQKLWN